MDTVLRTFDKDKDNKVVKEIAEIRTVSLLLNIMCIIGVIKIVGYNKIGMEVILGKYEAQKIGNRYRE